MNTKIVGYFAWVRTSKEPTCEKYELDKVSVFPEIKKARANVLIKEWPLTSTEFALTLDMLAQKYPLPVERA